MNAILKSLEHLAPHEKLQLVEDLWDSIAQEMVPVMSDELHAELERRAAWSDANPGNELTLQGLGKKLGLRL